MGHAMMMMMVNLMFWLRRRRRRQVRRGRLWLRLGGRARLVLRPHGPQDRARDGRRAPDQVRQGRLGRGSYESPHAHVLFYLCPKRHTRRRSAPPERSANRSKESGCARRKASTREPQTVLPRDAPPLAVVGRTSPRDAPHRRARWSSSPHDAPSPPRASPRDDAPSSSTRRRSSSNRSRAAGRARVVLVTVAPSSFKGSPPSSRFLPSLVVAGARSLSLSLSSRRAELCFDEFVAVCVDAQLRPDTEMMFTRKSANKLLRMAGASGDGSGSGGGEDLWDETGSLTGSLDSLEVRAVVSLSLRLCSRRARRRWGAVCVRKEDGAREGGGSSLHHHATE